jgi:hypothetical protein
MPLTSFKKHVLKYGLGGTPSICYKTTWCFVSNYAVSNRLRMVLKEKKYLRLSECAITQGRQIVFN